MIVLYPEILWKFILDFFSRPNHASGRRKDTDRTPKNRIKIREERKHASHMVKVSGKCYCQNLVSVARIPSWVGATANVPEWAMTVIRRCFVSSAGCSRHLSEIFALCHCVYTDIWINFHHILIIHVGPIYTIYNTDFQACANETTSKFNVTKWRQSNRDTRHDRFFYLHTKDLAYTQIYELTFTIS